MVKIQGYFHYCWTGLAQHQGHFCSSPARRLGMPRIWEGIQPGQVTPADPRDLPDWKWFSVYNAEGWRRNGGVWGGGVGFPSQCDTWGNTAFLDMAEHTLPMGSGAGTCKVLIACKAFVFLIKLPSTKPSSFLTFAFLIPSPILVWGEWVNVWVRLSCQLGLDLDKVSACGYRSWLERCKKIFRMKKPFTPY